MKNCFKLFCIIALTTTIVPKLSSAQPISDFPIKKEGLIKPIMENDVPNQILIDLGTPQRKSNALASGSKCSKTNEDEILVLATPDSERPQYCSQKNPNELTLDLPQLKNPKKLDFSNLISPISIKSANLCFNKKQRYLDENKSKSVIDKFPDTDLKDLILKCEKLSDEEFINEVLGLCKSIYADKDDYAIIAPGNYIPMCNYRRTISSLQASVPSAFKNIQFQYNEKLVLTPQKIVELLLFRNVIRKGAIVYKNNNICTRMTFTFDCNSAEATQFQKKLEGILCQGMIKLHEHLDLIQNRRYTQQRITPIKEFFRTAIGPNPALKDLRWDFKIRDEDKTTPKTFGDVIQQEFSNFLSEPENNIKVEAINLDENKEIAETCLLQICDKFENVLSRWYAFSKSIDDVTLIMKQYAKNTIKKDRVGSDPISEKTVIFCKLLERISEIGRFGSCHTPLPENNIINLHNPNVLKKKRNASKHLSHKRHNRKNKLISNTKDTITDSKVCLNQKI